MYFTNFYLSSVYFKKVSVAKKGTGFRNGWKKGDPFYRGHLKRMLFILIGRKEIKVPLIHIEKVIKNFRPITV